MSSELVCFAVSLLILLVMIAFLAANCYRKCPPNHAMIVSGMATGTNAGPFKIVTSGGTVVLPLIQMVNLIDLSIHKTVAALSTIYSTDNIPICASANLQFRIIPNDAGIANAATALLGMTGDEMAAVVENVIDGPFASALQRRSSSELKGDYAALTGEIMEQSKAGLEKIGVELTSVSIRSIDEVYDRRHAHGKPV
jgi:flotillin